jgi:hypothetical protein
MKSLFYHLILLSAVTLVTGPTLLLAQEQEKSSSVESLDLIKQGRSAFLATERDDQYDQLHLIERRRDGEIRVRKDVRWELYTDIALLPTTVQFRDRWLRDQNRYDRFKVSRADMRKIENFVAEQFQSIVSSQLVNDGRYAMNTSKGKQVLTIKPNIIDLNIAAPATSRAASSRQLTSSSAKMTIILELYDSESGVLLATTQDRIEDQYSGTLQAASSSTNKADTQRLLKRWASDLNRKLDVSSNNQLARKTTGTEPSLN